MPRLPSQTPRPDPVPPVLARLLWQWLVLGVLAVLVLALVRGPGQLPAALSFWLLAAPVASLVTLHRRWLATAWRARLVRATPRRRPRFGAMPKRSPKRGQTQFSRRLARPGTPAARG
ncbi:MAG TPA: hypothetical protein VFQ84_04975 [Arenimonas sp.]|uniref:hypothetical protein n=1 Tax=Arenimonas sp. TaxID=1872635 RepID=UPI002D7F4C0E|nr:hypothetical protein [Arenimonas sp.]HEU0152680.1 hypothetical protein [Arenimonas sp.]